jgi:hypothetical protein
VVGRSGGDVAVRFVVATGSGSRQAVAPDAIGGVAATSGATYVGWHRAAIVVTVAGGLRHVVVGGDVVAVTDGVAGTAAACFDASWRAVLVFVGRGLQLVVRLLVLLLMLVGFELVLWVLLRLLLQGELLLLDGTMPRLMLVMLVGLALLLLGLLLLLLAAVLLALLLHVLVLVAGRLPAFLSKRLQLVLMLSVLLLMLVGKGLHLVVLLAVLLLHVEPLLLDGTMLLLLKLMLLGFALLLLVLLMLLLVLIMALLLHVLMLDGGRLLVYVGRGLHMVKLHVVLLRGWAMVPVGDRLLPLVVMLSVL